MTKQMRDALESTPCRHRKLMTGEPRPCPFQSIVHNDFQPFCRCCDGCSDDCERAAVEVMERETDVNEVDC